MKKPIICAMFITSIIAQAAHAELCLAPDTWKIKSNATICQEACSPKGAGTGGPCKCEGENAGRTECFKCFCS